MAATRLAAAIGASLLAFTGSASAGARLSSGEAFDAADQRMKSKAFVISAEDYGVTSCRRQERTRFYCRGFTQQGYPSYTRCTYGIVVTKASRRVYASLGPGTCS